MKVVNLVLKLFSVKMLDIEGKFGMTLNQKVTILNFSGRRYQVYSL